MGPSLRLKNNQKGFRRGVFPALLEHAARLVGLHLDWVADGQPFAISISVFSFMRENEFQSHRRQTPNLNGSLIHGNEEPILTSKRY